jgi:hypothetical protein
MKAASVLGTTRQSSTALADGKLAERQLELSIFLPEAVRLRPVPLGLFFDCTDLNIYVPSFHLILVWPPRQLAGFQTDSVPDGRLL